MSRRLSRSFSISVNTDCHIHLKSKWQTGIHLKFSLVIYFHVSRTKNPEFNKSLIKVAKFWEEDLTLKQLWPTKRSSKLSQGHWTMTCYQVNFQEHTRLSLMTAIAPQLLTVLRKKDQSSVNREVPLLPEAFTKLHRTMTIVSTVLKTKSKQKLRKKSLSEKESAQEWLPIMTKNKTSKKKTIWIGEILLKSIAWITTVGVRSLELF